MLAAERQAKIAELIRVQGSVQVDDLAHDLKVSTMTIRRDLEKLQEDNILERCHGGAVAKQEVTYADKSTSHMQDKVRLAARCAPLVSAGDNIYLDAGTTTYEIAKAIQNVPDIMVMTNDLEIAGLLKNSQAELLRFDVGFFGAASINEELEVFTPTVDKAFLKRKALQRCRKAYLVVDESKFGKQAVTKVNHLADYTAVITTGRLSAEDRKKAEKSDVRLIYV